jgi:ketosteroid isomerase-like protein
VIVGKAAESRKARGSALTATGFAPDKNDKKEYRDMISTRIKPDNKKGDRIKISTRITPDNGLTRVAAPHRILESVVAALNQGQISKAVDQFDDDLRFTDHALGLEFTDKRRLTEFFQKWRELFPDTVVEVDSTFECGDHAIAEWKLTATESAGYGSMQFRKPIFLRGTSVVQTKNGRVTRWSDYYDQLTSRRVSVAAFFEDWVEL